jgi:hypothetical protein
MDDVTVEREVVWTLYCNGEPLRNAQGQIATFETEMEARRAVDEREDHRVPFQSLTERADRRAQAKRHARSSVAARAQAREDEDSVILLDG